MPCDDATLLDIARAARLVVQFSKTLDKEAFLRDLKTQSAILHQLLVLGESVKRLSSTFRAQHPEVSWRLYAGLRDVLIHQYDQVDLDEVWQTAGKAIPDLLSKLESLLPEPGE